MKNQGWRNDSREHAMARKGISTKSRGNRMDIDKETKMIEDIEIELGRSHEFKDDIEFWSVDEIKEFEKEYGEITSAKEGYSGRDEVIIETEEGEFRVFKDHQDAYLTAKEELVDMFETDSGTLPVDWVVMDNIYISETDKRIMAGEEADFILEDRDDEEILQMAGFDDEWEELEIKIASKSVISEDISEKLVNPKIPTKEKIKLEDEQEGLNLGMEELRANQDSLLDKARDKLTSEIYEEWYHGLDAPIQFLVEEQGLYSKEDLMKANFINIDYDGMAEDVVQHDGLGHVLSPYDFSEDEIGGAYIFTLDR